MEFSRRKFIKTTTSSVALSWGSMSILAGLGGAAESQSQALQGATNAHSDASTETPFIYGTQFFRPPSPPRAMRREMIKTIASDYKFNLIRVWPNWDYVNPQPDQWLFEEVEEVMNYCDEFGLRVLCGLMCELAPWWLEQHHPESRFVDARGRAMHLQSSPNNITGGWPGLCFDSQPVREACSTYIQKLIQVVSPHKSLFAYDCWNEPHVEPAWARNIWADPEEVLFCYCDNTIAAFRTWLKQKYSSLDGLNEAWTRRYPNWEAVEPPRLLSTYIDWIDWRGFMIERETGEMKFRVQTARSADPKHKMESHAAHHPPVDSCVQEATNGWRMAEQVDIWGMSLFPRWQYVSISKAAAKIEITRSNAAGKPFYFTELQAGHGNEGLWRSPEMRPEDIRLYNWLGVAMGAKGIIYWNYAEEATGRESTGYGLVGRDGSATKTSHEAARMNQIIQSHWDVIEDHHPVAEVALLTDQDNALLTYAADGNETPSTQSFQGYYKALWNIDLFVDFVEPRSLIGPNNTAHNYKVIIAPWHLIGKKTTLDALRSFVEAGGTLLIETAFGRYDEHAYYNLVVPPYGLDQVFGYREGDSLGVNPRPRTKDVAASDNIYYDPEIAFTQPISARIKGHTFLTSVNLTSGEVIAQCDGLNVATRKKVGKGWVYYFGTNLGASITAGSDEGIELLRAIVTTSVQPAVVGGPLRPRLIVGKQRSLLVVFNDHPTQQSSTLKLPGQFKKATDLFTGISVSIVDGSMKLTVPAQDVNVLRLE